jgi:hypothetical protein
MGGKTWRSGFSQFLRTRLKRIKMFKKYICWQQCGTHRRCQPVFPVSSVYLNGTKWWWCVEIVTFHLLVASVSLRTRDLTHTFVKSRCWITVRTCPVRHKGPQISSSVLRITETQSTLWAECTFIDYWCRWCKLLLLNFDFKTWFSALSLCVCVCARACVRPRLMKSFRARAFCHSYSYAFVRQVTVLAVRSLLFWSAQ